METTTLTSLLRQTAAENPEKAAIMDTIADTVETLVRRRYSVRRMVSELEPLAQDREVMRLVVEAFKSHVPLPALTLRDYRPCMVLIACSPEDLAFRYLCNDLVAVYERKYMTDELMFFCDLLRRMRGRSYLNCVINRVCDYFFRARRDTLRHLPTPLKESEMQYAESRMKELEKAVFRLKVKMYKWRTFTAEELADICGMSHSHFRSLFEKYYGCPPADWLRRERMERIRTDMSYRPELTVGEIAERNDFPSASNFSDFCRRQFDRSPQELKAEGEEEWREKRLEWWNGGRR